MPRVSTADARTLRAIDETPRSSNIHDVVSRPKKKVLQKRNARIGVAVIFVLLLVGFLYYFFQYQQLKAASMSNSNAAALSAVKQLSQIMVLPNDPNPILATVADKNKLQGQPFFTDAQNGDQVIIFPESMKAVLYRPSSHQIVDIAPLATNANPQTAGETSQATAPQPQATSASVGTKSSTPSQGKATTMP